MRRGFFALIAAAAVVAAALVITRGSATSEPQGADEDVLRQGQQIYADHCAACHGAELQGQPDWQTPLPNGRYPAPPHDETGHTWHHADGLLEQIVREGTAAVVGNGYVSDMPGFGAVLSDDQIRAVLAYIKSTWPERERALQRRISQDSAP